MKNWILLLPFIFLPFMGHAQVVGPGFVDYVTSAPSGSCSSNAHQRNVMGLGTVYTCQSGTWAQISGGGGGCAEGTCVVNAPVGNQTILGNHELNIPGLVGAGTSVDGYLNVGPAVSALSAFAQSISLPANEFSSNITSNRPDPVNSFGAAQFVVDSTNILANATNSFAAASLAADDSSNSLLEAVYGEAVLNLNGHSITHGAGTGVNGAGVAAISGAGIVFGTGTIPVVSGVFVGNTYENGSATVGVSTSFLSFAPILVSATPAIGINSGYYAQANNGIGTLNALFYGENQGAGASDYAIYLLGGKNNLGPQATTVGSLLTSTNCADQHAPAVCGSSASGAVAVPTGVNPTLVINTTKVTATSRIFLGIDETLTVPSTTCNTTLSTLVQPVVTARTAATSFTIQIGATLAANPACVSYFIVN